MLKLYATVGDTQQPFKNEMGETVYRTIEGEVVIKNIEAQDDDFHEKYNAIKALYPTSTVRFQG